MTKEDKSVRTDAIQRAAEDAGEAALGLRSATLRFRLAAREVEERGGQIAPQTEIEQYSVGLDTLQLAAAYLGCHWDDPALQRDLATIRSTSPHQPGYATGRDLAQVVLQICDRIENGQ